MANHKKRPRKNLVQIWPSTVTTVDMIRIVFGLILIVAGICVLLAAIIW